MDAEYSRQLGTVVNSTYWYSLPIMERVQLQADLLRYDRASDLPPDLAQVVARGLGGPPAPTPAPVLNQQIVGNVGLYYVCYQLSRRGWNVMPTARNARGVDLIIYSQDAKRTSSVQVKALSRASPVPLGGHLDHLFADFVIVCRHATAPIPECFVMVPTEVRALVHKGDKAGKVSYWLQPKAYDVAEYRERWDRVGDGTRAAPSPRDA